MKKTLSIITLVTFLFGALTNGGCNSGSTAGGQSNLYYTTTKDLDNFFTITFNNRTLTSYGLIINYAGELKYPVCGILHYTSDGINYPVQTSIGLNCIGNQLNIYNNAPYNFNYFEPISAFFSQSDLIHSGSDITGIYIGNNGITNDSHIDDLENASKRYYIESSNSFIVNVTSAVNDIITGTFTCILLDGQNRIPASGSFRAKHV